MISHELRPFDYYVDYRQTVLDLRLNKEPSGSIHRYKDVTQLVDNSRVVSASPFRATVKLDREKLDSDSSDQNDDFARETMS